MFKLRKIIMENQLRTLTIFPIQFIHYKFQYKFVIHLIKFLIFENFISLKKHTLIFVD
jgi:hypothetical protein